MNNRKARLIPIDLLKILFAALIFMRHVSTMGGVDWHSLNRFALGSTTPVMTGFFMLSGFSLFYQHGDSSVFRDSGLAKYYKKRLIGLMPLYLFVHVVYLLYYSYDIKDALRLMPVELLGIQTWYNSLFGVLHNGGTWFVSCLLFCYFVYPLLQELLAPMKFVGRVMTFLLIGFVSVYSQLVISWYGCSTIYADPLFRFLEFGTGAALCSVRECFKKEKTMLSNGISLAVFAASLLVLYKATMAGIWFLFLPLLSTLILSASEIVFLNNKKCRIIRYFSSLAYSFFIMQCILWKQFYSLLERFPLFEINKYRFILAFGLLFAESILVHEIFEKPVQRLLRKHI